MLSFWLAALNHCSMQTAWRWATAPDRQEVCSSFFPVTSYWPGLEGAQGSGDRVLSLMFSRHKWWLSLGLQHAHGREGVGHVYGWVLVHVRNQLLLCAEDPDQIIT